MSSGEAKMNTVSTSGESCPLNKYPQAWPGFLELRKLWQMNPRVRWMPGHQFGAVAAWNGLLLVARQPKDSQIDLCPV
ncbi:MAG: hypothetical protein CMF59_15705 [Leptospiraceae bacterium]|nr:hypothetical protein [Leptospiraceae bacterium]